MASVDGQRPPRCSPGIPRVRPISMRRGAVGLRYRDCRSRRAVTTTYFDTLLLQVESDLLKAGQEVKGVPSFDELVAIGPHDADAGKRHGPMGRSLPKHLARV